MQPASPFEQLMRQLRRGDPDAAREIVEKYANEVRRSIRVRLTDPRLRRTLDSMDVCQSVLANFFLRLSRGQYDLGSPQALLALLCRMARNKLVDLARRADARGRQHHLVGGEADRALAQATAGLGGSPSERAVNRDLLEAADRLMTAEERYLAHQRAAGRPWAELAAELGSSPEALRKQLSRALDRVACQLGLDTLHGEEEGGG